MFAFVMKLQLIFKVVGEVSRPETHSGRDLLFTMHRGIPNGCAPRAPSTRPLRSRIFSFPLISFFHSLDSRISHRLNPGENNKLHLMPYKL